jgi:hypothetical protein
VATIEPKTEFIKVIVEVLVLNATLVSAVSPPLEKCGDDVDARHNLMRHFHAAVYDRDTMVIACLC